jgi:hypothetical protein
MLQGGDFTRHNVSCRHTRPRPRQTRYLILLSGP